jgi:hypothetical protein
LKKKRRMKMMKTRCRFLSVVLVLLLFVPFIVAADDQEQKNALSLDLVGPTVKGIQSLSLGNLSLELPLEYERVLADHFTLAFPLYVSYYNNKNVGGNDFWSMCVEPWIGLDWHPFDKGLGGFFVGPYMVISFNYDTRLTMSDSTYYFIGWGASIGYKFLFGNVLDLDLTLRYVPWGLLIADQSLGSIASSSRLRVEVGIGYRF